MKFVLDKAKYLKVNFATETRIYTELKSFFRGFSASVAKKITRLNFCVKSLRSLRLNTKLASL